VRHVLDDAGVTHELHQSVSGKDVAEEIVDQAEARKARLIVIGLRRRTATGKFLFGSNAQRVLLDADCPVLAVKAPNQHQHPTSTEEYSHADPPGRPRPHHRH
jgi:nucleotide-binding universal stress UspA family protein